ncbi:hypothetical protein V5D56_09310 [Cellulosimicrobium sp. PMB13]|uniref:hypothetical protein n=1 Tax=Cellulosimicrobium sp. PMB13 TaxID=3120158 RepID=UPI003F4B6F8E
MTGRTPLLRALVGFALLGAGVVNLGLVRGTFPAPAGFLALGLGVTEVVTALLALADARPRGLGPTTLGRVGIGALVAGSVAQAALAVSGGGTLGPTVTAASVLQLAGAGMLGVLTRAASGRDGTSVPDGPSGSQHPGGPGADTAARSGPAGGLRTAGALAALFAGAILVSTVATFGLGATEAGEHAVPHGDHRPPRPPGLHGHHP